MHVTFYTCSQRFFLCFSFSWGWNLDGRDHFSLVALKLYHLIIYHMEKISSNHFEWRYELFFSKKSGLRSDWVSQYFNILNFWPTFLKIVDYKPSEGSGSKFFDPSWVNVLLLRLGRVWVWKIFPKNINFSVILPHRVKKNLIGLGQKVPWVGLLFYVGQKYAWVWSGQGPSLL